MSSSIPAAKQSILVRVSANEALDIHSMVSAPLGVADRIIV
ncbi:hypothetical protein [Cohnella abietis]|nr:hypothetical protein [Cohnella abietis]